MHFKYFTLSLLFAVIGASVLPGTGFAHLQTTEQLTPSYSLAADENQKHQILNRPPNLPLKEDGRPKGTVGVLLYTYDKNGDTFILLGQERKGKTGEGTYCDLGGSLELIKDSAGNRRAETFLEAAVRECAEESAGLYKLDSQYVAEKGKVYFQHRSSREVITVFLEAPQYIPDDQLLAACQQSRKSASQEKTDFKWVKAADLQKPIINDRLTATDITGRTLIIRLRSFLVDMLKDKNFQQVISNIQK